MDTERPKCQIQASNLEKEKEGLLEMQGGKSPPAVAEKKKGGMFASLTKTTSSKKGREDERQDLKELHLALQEKDKELELMEEKVRAVERQRDLDVQGERSKVDILQTKWDEVSHELDRRPARVLSTEGHGGSSLSLASSALELAQVKTQLELAEETCKLAEIRAKDAEERLSAVVPAVNQPEYLAHCDACEVDRTRLQAEVGRLEAEVSRVSSTTFSTVDLDTRRASGGLANQVVAARASQLQQRPSQLTPLVLPRAGSFTQLNQPVLPRTGSFTQLNQPAPRTSALAPAVVACPSTLAPSVVVVAPVVEAASSSFVDPLELRKQHMQAPAPVAVVNVVSASTFVDPLEYRKQQQQQQPAAAPPPPAVALRATTATLPPSSFLPKPQVGAQPAQVVLKSAQNATTTAAAPAPPRVNKLADRMAMFEKKPQ